LSLITIGLLPVAVGLSRILKKTYVWFTNSRELSPVANKVNDIGQTQIGKTRREQPAKEQRMRREAANKSGSTKKNKKQSETSEKIAASSPPGKSDESDRLCLSTKSIKWDEDFVHVNILNNQGYTIDGEPVHLGAPSKPEKIDRDSNESDETFTTTLSMLRDQLPPYIPEDSIFKIKDMTTDQAIITGDQLKIALNFANERMVGGGSGIYKDMTIGKIIWSEVLSAEAQEESLISKSDLFSSLTLLDITAESRNGDKRIRNYYKNDGFNSKNTAYVSDNQLFGVQVGPDFYKTQFLKNPRSVSFVTSAAADYNHLKSIPVDKNSEAYKDATDRIRTHLYAAAKKAVELKNANQGSRVELILGAFGCGAFAPTGNPKEYANMIAQIYKKELTLFEDFFNDITFAIPRLGKTDPKSPFVRNYDVFASVFK
jgi:uncharacterized protein (TIGR02452 family)